MTSPRTPSWTPCCGGSAIMTPPSQSESEGGSYSKRAPAASPGHLVHGPVAHPPGLHQGREEAGTEDSSGRHAPGVGSPDEPALAPRHTVTVTTASSASRMVWAATRMLEQPPVTRRCTLTRSPPRSANELGLQAVTTYQVFDHEQQVGTGRRPWPGGNDTRITWDGRTFQQEANPWSTMSRHVATSASSSTALAAKAR
ncbi:hypothetical protein QJS66_02445 [Kocuria rhizophila]|nr:hypothetical protein QJS66_02445 [Kocuria rhizophila]